MPELDRKISDSSEASCLIVSLRRLLSIGFADTSGTSLILRLAMEALAVMIVNLIPVS